MNKNYFIFLTILIPLIVCLPVQSQVQRFGCETNHKQFNRDAINLLHNVNNPITGKPEDQLLLPEDFSETELVNELDAGNEDEDLTACHFDVPFELPIIGGNTVSCTRGHLHFLDFETKKGFNTDLLYSIHTEFNSAYQWAIGGDLIPAWNHNDYTFNNAVALFKGGDYYNAYQYLGHVMHLLQDMGVPAHTRNDAHGPDMDWLNFIMGQRLGHDYFEDYCGRTNMSAYNSNLDLAPIYGETTELKLQSLFYDLAHSTGSLHFSDDSIWEDGHSAPQWSAGSPYLEGHDKENHTSRYYLNKNNKILLVVREDDFHTYIDDIVCESYWEEISPNVVTYSASLLKLFQDECFPHIESITPNRVYLGDEITINGKNFGEAQGNSIIKFKDVEATAVTSWSETQIIGQVPAVLGKSVPVVVKVHQAKSKEYKITVELMPFIGIAANNFPMGSSQGDGYDYEQPQHFVSLNAYDIGKYEVTNKQFEIFVNDAGYTPEGDWRHFGSDCNPAPSDYPDNYPDYPVINITWNDAKAFCDWATALEASQADDSDETHVYSLPTEAQWECAAQNTNTNDCNYIEGTLLTGMLNILDGRGTTPVGSYSSGASGVMDMAGNVWEWCADWFDPNYYSNSPSDNPTGPANGTYRVIRGGSWSDAADYCSITYRGKFLPSHSDPRIGFRCVRTLIPKN
jgi:formylglycine-generating enzyme